MENENKIILSVMKSSRYLKTLQLRDKIKKVTISVLKCNKLSELYRQNGNDIFNNQLHDSSSHEKIWELYSKSVIYAQSLENLALAHGNRSAILLHMSKYEDCLIDINRALDITRNICLQIKLLIRKAKCLHALGSDKSEITLAEAESLLEKIKIKDLVSLFVNDIKETKFMLKKPFEPLETFNKRQLGAKLKLVKTLIDQYQVDDFSSVEIQRDEKYGRSLIATRNIEPGEIVYIEKPYVHCVNMENVHLYCSHCLTATWAGIPCDHCAWTMFCSEKCKEEAYKQYHGMECSLFNCTKRNYDDRCAQLAIKTLCLALKEYGGIENLKAELAEFNKSKDEYKGFNKKNEICSSGFKTMYMLSHDVTNFKIQEYKESVILFHETLLKSTELLAENFSDKNINNFLKKENIFFLSALFLRLCTVSEINKLEMWNGSYQCPDGSILKSQCCTSNCCSRGDYIALITSLINHSCYPNVNVCYNGDHNAIIYALRPIKKGEHILRCYQDEFYLMEKSIRKRLLNNTYNFQCNCEACFNNWPTLLLKQDVTTNPQSSCLSTEVELVQSSHKRFIHSCREGTVNYNCIIIDYLRKDLEEALKDSSQPSLITVDLMKSLSTIFNQLYGITFSVPSKCNSEIKCI